MLALLTEGPQYGLRLHEEFEDRTWALNAAQIQTTLRRPERDGLAGSDGSTAPSAGLTRGRQRVPDA